MSPGTYSVHLAKRVDGKLVDLGLSERFEVERINDRGAMEGASIAERTAFAQRLAKTSGAVSAAGRSIGENLQRVQAIQQVLMRSTLDEPALDDQARELERRLSRERTRRGL